MSETQTMGEAQTTGAAQANDEQPKGLVTIKYREASDALPEMWVLHADWCLGHEEFPSEAEAEARKAVLEPEFAAWVEAQKPEPEPERTPCAAPETRISTAKFRKLLARGGVLVASDGAHQIEDFAPVPFALDRLEQEPNGAHYYSGAFMVSTIGMARGVQIAGFAIKAKLRGDVLAFSELPGGLSLAPGQQAEIRKGTLVFMTDPAAK